jgi:alpha-beta hydrolase superfamily lysophospholipase
MLEDIDAARGTLTEHCPGVPQWLFGHSMGGNLVANYTLRWKHNLRGVILSAPMLLPANPPKRDQIFAAWLTGKILPFVRFSSPVNPDQLTHDQAEIERASNDPLMHSRISLRLGTQLLAQGRYVLDHASRLSVPTLVLHGDTDSTTDTSASHAFCLRVGDRATYVNFPDMLHDILHEIDRDQVFRTLTSWLLDQMDLQVNADGKE